MVNDHPGRQADPKRRPLCTLSNGEVARFQHYCCGGGVLLEKALVLRMGNEPPVRQVYAMVLYAGAGW